MAQQEIIEMAKQAGLLVIGTADGGEAVYTWPAGITEEIEAFAKLIAAKEREEIAQFIDSTELASLPDALKQHYARMLSFYSSQIRARGEA